MEIQRSALSELRERCADSPAVSILGPRQCGKTTLARQLGADHWFDLENPRDLARLQEPQLALEQLTGRVALDEVQRRPDLFPLLRFLIDTRPDLSWLLLGSASPDLLRQGGESLAGRLSLLRLGPLTLEETLPIDSADSSETLWRLWLRGGLPRSLLASSDAASRRWRDDYIALFLERDLPQLGVSIPASTLRRFWTMLSHYHGSVLNHAELGRSFGISDMTVRNYLAILVGSFMVRLLPPWHTNTSKRLVKSPKLYLRDSGLFHRLQAIDTVAELQAHAKLGASWEGFALENCTQSIGGPDERFFFWGTHAGAELDLFWQEGGRNYGIEFKYGDTPKLTRSMRSAFEDLELEHLWIVVPAGDEYPLESQVSVRPLGTIGAKWRY